MARGSDAPLPRLADFEFLVVTGKGGVGKSTLTAALAHKLAAAGRRCLALEADPRESLHQLLDAPPSCGEIVAAGPRLYLQNLQARQVLEQELQKRLKWEALARRVLDSPLFQSFTDGAPGLKEMALLGHAQALLRGQDGAPELDAVLLDAPATGHGLALLEAPRLVADVIRSGPIGELAQEISAFVADASRCAVLAVTLAEEMPVQESLELAEGLRRRFGRPPVLLVVNALYPPSPRRGGGAAGALWRERRRINQRNLERLRSEWQGPLLELPLLPMERGPELAGALAEAWP